MRFLKIPMLYIIKRLQPSRVHLLLGEEASILKEKSKVLSNNFGSGGAFSLMTPLS